MQIDKSRIIEKYLVYAGRPVTILMAGEEYPLSAVIEKAWRRTKTRFGNKETKIGYYSRTHYFYIGPSSFDITQLGDDDCIFIDGEKYRFIEKDSVVVGETVQFYRGVIKKAGEDEDSAFAT